MPEVRGLAFITSMEIDCSSEPWNASEMLQIPILSTENKQKAETNYIWVLRMSETPQSLLC